MRIQCEWRLVRIQCERKQCKLICFQYALLYSVNTPLASKITNP